MQKIRFIIPKENLSDILKEIALFECVDFYEIDKLPELQNLTLEKLKADIDISLSLSPYVAESVLPKNTEAKEFFEFAKEKVLILKNLRQERQEIFKKNEELKKFEGLNFSYADAKKLVWLKVILLEGAADDHSKLQEIFGNKVAFEETGNSQDSKTFLYLLPHNLLNEFLSRIKGLQLRVMPFFDFAPKFEIQNLRKSLKIIDENIAKIEAELRKKAPDLAEWQKFLFELKWQEQVLTLQTKAPHSNFFAIFEGWVIKNRLAPLIDRLKRISEYLVIEEIPFSPDEAPVQLANKKAKPFEMVTKLYGMPKATEVDPTPYLAPFFVVFFGFALSDAGYGLALSIMGAMLLAFKNKFSKLVDLAKLSIILGLSTMVFGYILGTFWGINLNKIIDPQLQPMLILSVCFVLGILQIIWGMTINFVHKFNQGAKFIDLMQESGFWILILIAIFILILQNIFPFKLIPAKILLQIVGAILLVNVLSRIIFSSSKILGLFKGLAGLYSGVSFLADTLSYSRLFALGLATGVVAYTVNLVAGILKNMINFPIISEIVFLTVLIVGHLFNMAINVLGAFIHSSRLQFVEFFSKFLEGGGRQFNPLRYKYNVSSN